MATKLEKFGIFVLPDDEQHFSEATANYSHTSKGGVYFKDAHGNYAEWCNEEGEVETYGRGVSSAAAQCDLPEELKEKIDAERA